jgi:hypothetical protein
MVRLSSALIAMLVIAGDTSHQLLCINEREILDFGYEVSRVAASQCRSQLPVVKHFD